MPKMSLELGDATLSESENVDDNIKYTLILPIINKGNMPARYRVNISSEFSDGTESTKQARGFVRVGKTRNVTMTFEHFAKGGSDLHTVELFSFLLGPFGTNLEMAKTFNVDIFDPMFGTAAPFAVVRTPTGIEQAVKVRFEGDP